MKLLDSGHLKIVLLFVTAFFASPYCAIGFQLTDDSPTAVHPWQDSNIGPDTLVAQIGNDQVVYQQVQNQLWRSIGNRPAQLSPEQYRLLQAKALEQLVEQRLVVSYLKSIGEGASKGKLDVEVKRLQDRVRSIGKDFDSYLAENFLTERLLRKQLAWQVCWREYLGSQLTDSNLERLFESNRKLYDGTRVRIAHVLIKPDDPANSESWQTAQQTIGELAENIADASMSWEQVVEQYSQAATTDHGGELGWIKNDGTMHKSLTDVALFLDVGQISKPVKSPFGYHLIKCLEVEPGSSTWKDVARQLRADGAKRLFDWVVKRHRPHAQVEFTGASPYIDPDTRQLVAGQTPQ